MRLGVGYQFNSLNVYPCAYGQGQKNIGVIAVDVWGDFTCLGEGIFKSQWHG